jgi:general secretion pathway protein D
MIAMINKLNTNTRHLFGIFIPIIMITILFMSGCALKSTKYSQGEKLFQSGNYDEAVKHLAKDYQKNPNHQTKLMLFRAKMSSYYHHLGRARILKEAKKKEEAVKEYNIALSVFPNNIRIKEELDIYLLGKRKKKKPFKSEIVPPVSLGVDSSEKMSLNLRSTPITKIFKVVGKSYGVNFIFDKDFRDFVYSIDIDQIGFYEILNQLCMIGNAEYRVLDKTSVLVYPNTNFKKRTFGLKGVKVFYLSNVKAEDAKKLLMTMFRDQQIQAQEDASLNSLIIKGSYGALVEIERFLKSIDKSKSEVAIDIQIMEITKNMINALGTSFGKVGDSLSNISMENTDATDTPGKFNFNNIKGANFFFTVPNVSLSFLESNADSKLIARPNLRGMDGEEIKFMVGDEVPVPQTQFQAGAAGGVNNVPVTTYQYKNVGVEIKVTPFIHRNNEVTLKIKLTINSVTSIENGFPTFGKRELENVIRLKEGETNIIGGFIKDEVRDGVSGIPGFSKLPLIGKLFGSSGKEVKQTDVVFAITPRVIRKVNIDSTDKGTIWSNAQQAGAGSSVKEPPSRGERGTRPGGARQQPRGGGNNSVVISPAKRRSPINSVAFFTLRLNSREKLQSLAISGSISGGKAVIEEVKTNFFGKSKVDILSNFSESSFDLGYTFPAENVRANVVAQLKVKFMEKGTFTINLNNLNAVSKDRQSVELKGSTAEVEVY